MSIIQDQQLIESLSDQDLARLIQGEVPQLAHLASIGVSETTRRLDFRREYQEELDRLDNPLGQEDISTQMAMKLLSGGVPTVNEGVTDEFPQGGIAGQQQAPQQQATQQAAAPQQGAATQAAAPQAAPAPAPAAAPAAGGAGAVPGMASGGPVNAAIPWWLWSLIGSTAGAVLPPAFRAGSKYLSPAIKRQLAKIKPAVRSGVGRVAPESYRRYPSGPVRKEKYPWMGQGIKGKWPRGEKIPQRPGTIIKSLEDKGRMFLGDVIGNVKPLAITGTVGGGIGTLGGIVFGEGEPTIEELMSQGDYRTGHEVLPDGRIREVIWVGSDHPKHTGETSDSMWVHSKWLPDLDGIYKPKGRADGGPVSLKGYQSGAFLGDQEQDLYSILVELLGDKASQISPLDIPAVGTQERYDLEEMIRQQLPISDPMSVRAPESWGGTPLRLPGRLPERDLTNIDISGDPLIDLLLRPRSEQEMLADSLMAVDPSRVEVVDSVPSELDIQERETLQTLDQLFSPQSPTDMSQIEQTVRSVLDTMDRIQGDQDYSGVASAIQQMFPEDQSLESAIRAQMDALDTLTPEEIAMLEGREESIENRFRDREKRIALLREIGGRYEDPSSLERYLADVSEMQPELQEGDMRARGLAGVANVIANNIFPGDLGRGLSSLAVQSADRMQENRIRDEARNREMFAAEQDRQRLYDEYRSTALEAELSSGIERDNARERLDEYRDALARRSEDLLPNLFSAIQSKQERDIAFLLDIVQAERMGEQQIMSLLASLISSSTRGGANASSPGSWMADINQIWEMKNDILQRLNDGTPPPPKVMPGTPEADQKKNWENDLEHLKMLDRLLEMHGVLNPTGASGSYNPSGILGTPPNGQR
jgi:hypothetical protein